MTVIRLLHCLHVALSTMRERPVHLTLLPPPPDPAPLMVPPRPCRLRHPPSLPVPAPLPLPLRPAAPLRWVGCGCCHRHSGVCGAVASPCSSATHHATVESSPLRPSTVQTSSSSATSSETATPSSTNSGSETSSASDSASEVGRGQPDDDRRQRHHLSI